MNNRNEKIENQEKRLLASLGMRRIIWPVLIGVVVIAFLIWRQFDLEEFRSIPLNEKTLYWIGIAIGLLIIKHLAYSFRLRVLSDKFFSWWKSIELIFIWEFSSAISPTSLGGSAVALFMLAQEKLAAARATALVIYTVILDTFFFLTVIPLFFILYGPRLIRPDMVSLWDKSGWGFTFLLVILLMLSYGGFFFYGLIINPRPLRRLLLFFTRIPILRRFRGRAVTLGNDLVIAAKDFSTRDYKFPLYAFLATAVAWSCRFLIINAVVMAFVEAANFEWFDQLLLYGRSGTMFMIMAFSPTPGGSGFAEIVFGGFLADFIPTGIAPIMASIWRLLSYYFYIFAGLVIVPNWVRKIIARRVWDRKQEEEEE
jgi:glycosyltransferase 2 family protein